MKSGKPKTKRYQFGGTLRSQISGTRNAPPPTRPAPAPAKTIPATKAVGPIAPYKGPVPVTPPGGQVQDKINTKPPLNKMGDILSGRAPAPNIPSTPNKPPVGFADDMAGIYAAAKNQPQIFGPQAPMPAGGPMPAASTMPATTATAKPAPLSPQYMKKGGAVKAYAKGGKVSSASSRGDGIAQRGKTKGRMV